MAGNFNSPHTILERRRRIAISIPGYDAGKEVKKNDDRFKRIRAAAKLEKEIAVRKARQHQDQNFASTDAEIEALNLALAPVPGLNLAAATNQEESGQCLFL